MEEENENLKLIGNVTAGKYLNYDFYDYDSNSRFRKSTELNVIQISHLMV